MRKVIKNIDIQLLIATLLLFIIGLVMIFSASNVTAYMRYAVSPYHYFILHGAFLVLGFIMFLVMIRFNTKVYGILSYFLMALFIVLLVLLLIVGKAKNQAVSWFDLGIVNFQPSEFIKVITIIFLAYYYDEKKKSLNDIKVVYFSLIICGIICGLIILQPDFGTAIIYFLIVFAIFLSQPIPSVNKLKIIGMGFSILLLIILLLSVSGKNILGQRQLSRIENLKNPCDRLLTDGNQVCNGYIAMNNGGMLGKGLGNSTQKYLYLPEPYTDFIWAILIEELGAGFGLFVLILYLYILIRILIIGRNSWTNRGSTICYGVAVYIFLHIAVNLLGIMGLIPMTGVPLPFMSYGGSFTICLIAALTAVQSVSVETGIRNEKNK